jgi:hypothetical protein
LGDPENKKIINVGAGLVSAHAITLISLVIKIILLLILASVAINLSLGDNGLFTIAKQAKEEYLNAQTSEEEGLNDLYSEMLVATGDDSKITISVEDLKKLIAEEVEEKTASLQERIAYLEENSIKYPDYSRVLTTITTQDASWTATEDCVLTGSLKVLDYITSFVYVDGLELGALCNQSSSSSSYTRTSVYFYIKKGSVITTRSDGGTYDLTVYALK